MLSSCFDDDDISLKHVLCFLLEKPALLKIMKGKKEALLKHESGEKKYILVRLSLLLYLAKQFLIVRKNGIIFLTDAGQSFAKDVYADKNKSYDQNGSGKDEELATHNIESTTSVQNWKESPLSQLTRRKGKDGKPFLSEAEFRAGERLRSDYTHGQMMPRIGMNWDSQVIRGKKSSVFSGSIEVKDSVLAAQMRVEKAVKAVGPELSGILIDVCCFLKGLEKIEMERCWPIRSAKVVLKTALGVLARHYEPKIQIKKTKLHWGQSDYKPSL